MRVQESMEINNKRRSSILTEREHCGEKSIMYGWAALASDGRNRVCSSLVVYL